MGHIVNIGKHECRIRIGLGLFFFATAGLTALPDWASLGAFCLGAILLYTGIHHFCPLWKWLGINTSDQPRQKHH